MTTQALTSVRELSAQLVQSFKESNIEQIAAFEKTTLVFQDALNAIDENVQAHAVGFAQLIEQTTALEGRANQLEKKLKTQNELTVKQENALEQRLLHIAGGTKRLQQLFIEAETRKIADTKIVAEYEKSCLASFQELSDPNNRKISTSLELTKECQILEAIAKQMENEGVASVESCRQTLSAIDSDIDTLTNRYNGHSHVWYSHNDYTGVTHANYSSGPSK